MLQGNAAARADRAWISVDTNFFRQDAVTRTPGLPDTQVPEMTRARVGDRAGARVAERVDVRVRARLLHDRLDGVSSRVAPNLGVYRLEEPNDTKRATLHFVEKIDLGRGSSLRLTLGRQWTDNTTALHQEGSSVGEQHDRHHRMHSFEAVATIADGQRTWVAGTRGEVENFRQTMTKTESLSEGLVTQTQDEVTPQILGRTALFAQLQWRLTDAFTLLGGVRSELHKTYGSAVTPRLALSYALPEILLRASGGRGFRVPSAKELGFVFDHSALGYRVIGNPNLTPETSWGINGDVTWRSTRETTLRAGAFMNWVDNLIEIDLASGTASGAVVDYRYQNVGKARTFGVDLAGTARVGRFRADLAYDYLFTRDDVTDQPLGGRPAHTLTASISASLPWKLEAYARWRASSDAFVSTELRAPGYQTIDLRLMREVWPKSQAYVGVLNLTDVHQEPGRVADMRPPLGRAFYAGLRAELPWEEE